jgi:hypothetical protein
MAAAVLLVLAERNRTESAEELVDSWRVRRSVEMEVSLPDWLVREKRLTDVTPAASWITADLANRTAYG